MRRLILGPPGTGKTTTLLDLVDRYIGQGVPPDRIAFLAFTRAAASEAVARAVTRFNVPASSFPYFRTLHSLAYRMLGLGKHEVMSAVEWEQFADAQHLDLRIEHRKPQYLWETPTNAHGPGNEALRCYQLARARCVTIEQEWMAGGYEAPLWFVQRFVQALDAFKHERMLLDYSDFLDQLTSPLDVDVVIVDEAQDLTQQQWRLLSRLSSRARDVIFAGDDDQAIYQWAGADLQELLRTPWERRVLPLSYRLSQPVKDLAERIISKSAKRFDKVFRAAGHAGRVEALPVQEIEVGEGSWLFLARTNAQASSMLGIARDSGRVYEHNGLRSTNTPAVKAVLAYQDLIHGRAIKVAAWDALKRHASTCAGVTHVGLREVHPHALPAHVQEWLVRAEPWYTALQIPLKEATYIRSLLRRGEKLDAPANVRVMTVHQAKGLEADNVVLFGKQHKHTGANEEEEVRIWYVGATRARRRLILTHHEDNRWLM